MKHSFIRGTVRVLMFGLVALSVSNSVLANSSTCPNLELKETPADCPWAEVARTLQVASDIPSELTQKLPRFLTEISSLTQTPDLLRLWGRSINYDEYAKGTIVQPELLDVILATAKAPPRNDRVVHAGLEHTYGYLFSTLLTPFGYKRARWVQPDIEIGLELPAGSLRPSPKSGSFLANVTALGAAIALTDSPFASNVLKKTTVDPSLKKALASPMSHTRLIETIVVSKTRTVELRTDFVPFKKRIEGSTNAALLIYSARETQNGKLLDPELITLFPVANDFLTKALNPEFLGEQQKIITRYNAFIPEVAGTATPWIGSRKVVQIP